MEEYLLKEGTLEIDKSETDGKYLTFWTDKQLFGVSIAHVIQIVAMQEVTKIPEYPYYAKGIINLRGNIIPVIDVRLRFNKEEAPYSERTCIIVTNINNKSIGFIVDAVDSVTYIANENISPPPRMASDISGTYLTGLAKVENRVVLLLDTSKILKEDALSVFTE